jgi:hypothetical protein
MTPTLTINPDLFFAKEWEKGFTWTLPSRLGDMLHLAQELFGPRDSSYTILGIEFVSDNPRIWYPGQRRDIIVQLDYSAATNMSQACYQLAHETVHLLSPTGNADSINFEEGLASHFASYYMKTRLDQPFWQGGVSSYRRPHDLVTPRLNEDLYCVRRLRNKQPSFPKMSRADIGGEFPSLSLEDLDFLVSQFDRNAT